MTATAIATGTAVEAIGSRWMLHPEQFAASTAAGFAHPFAGYFAGRGGVLGDVDATVVAATFAVFEPGVVAQMWTAGARTHAPRDAALLYAGQAGDWATRHLAGADDIDRFVELSERVIEVAPTAGLPLFAGWRALPRAERGPGRALQNALVLRELQGGVHLSALTAAGIEPVEAHLLNKGRETGPEYCAFFGWAGPYPDVSAKAAAYAEVRNQTVRRMASLINAVLSADEAGDLARAASALSAHLHR